VPDVDAILDRASQIRRDQRLVEPQVESEGCDLVDHGSISLAAIPDAREFGADLERSFVARSRAGIGVLLVGIDRARLVQDTFGPRALDAAMNSVANHVRAHVPVKARLYRFVGAELAVLVPETEIEDLCRLAESVRRAVASGQVPLEHATESSFPITVTIGAAIYEPSDQIKGGVGIETPDQLVRAAMFALANGRRARNRVVVFRRELTLES
jgi:diguanylate cyclase (GGDEF)-like protein